MGLFSNIVDRWKAKETRFGEILVKGVCFIGLTASTIGGSLEYLGAIPQDWIPESIKMIILVSAIVGGVIGKLTKHPDHDNPKKD